MRIRLSKTITLKPCMESGRMDSTNQTPMWPFGEEKIRRILQLRAAVALMLGNEKRVSSGNVQIPST